MHLESLASTMADVGCCLVDDSAGRQCICAFRARYGHGRLLPCFLAFSSTPAAANCLHSQLVSPSSSKVAQEKATRPGSFQGKVFGVRCEHLAVLAADLSTAMGQACVIEVTQLRVNLKSISLQGGGRHAHHQKLQSPGVQAI